MADLADELGSLLKAAVSSCLASAGHPGILFSGGLDSGILAVLASKISCRRSLLLVAGSPGSRDVVAAREAARELHLPLEVCLFTLDDVERKLPSIIAAAGSTDVLQVSLAIPLFFAAGWARRLGINLLVSGQGADELFGGYARYERLLLEAGPEAVHSEMEEDLTKLNRVTLPCQLATVQYHGLQMATPYLDRRILDFAGSLPLRHKLQVSNGIVIRKLILRRLARKLKLPSLIVDAKKRAAQYGSGASKFLARLSQSYWRRVEPGLSQREASSWRRIHRFLVAQQRSSHNGFG